MVKLPVKSRHHESQHEDDVGQHHPRHQGPDESCDHQGGGCDCEVVEGGRHLGLVVAGQHGAGHQAQVDQEPGHRLQFLVFVIVPLISGEDLVGDDGHEVVERRDEEPDD